MNSIPQRIKQLAKELNLSISAFEKQIGSSNNTIGTAIHKDSNISGAIINKILIRYTELSPDWLITGTGSMMRGEKNKVIVHDQKDALIILDKIKIIDLQNEVIAGLKIEKKRLEIDLALCEASKKSD